MSALPEKSTAAAPLASAPHRAPVVTVATGAVSVGITETDQASLLDDLAARLAAGQGFAVATLNLDHLVKLGRDPAFRDAYAAHTHVTADGRPITWLARLAGREVGLVTGSDLLEPLIARAAAGRHGVALIGATEEALQTAAKRLAKRHPGLDIVAQIAPPFGLDPEGPEAMAAVEAAAEAGATLILLALGAPRQERLAARASARFPGIGFVSIGAGIDFVAGTQIRAPAWVRAIALEWVWRLLSAPGRLAGRYAACALILPGAIRATRQRARMGEGAE